MTTNSRAPVGVSPPISTDTRTLAPATRRLMCSKVKRWSTRPLAGTTSRDALTSDQSSARWPIHSVSTPLARDSATAESSAGYRSVSANRRQNPVTRPSGAKRTRVSCTSPGVSARTVQRYRATSPDFTTWSSAAFPAEGASSRKSCSESSSAKRTAVRASGKGSACALAKVRAASTARGAVRRCCKRTCGTA